MSRSLEKSLGVPLFTRSQSGLLPTEAALALRSHAEAMNSTAASLRRAAESHGDGVRGTVRVSASEVIGAEVLPPILAKLRQQHPQLKVELVLTNRVQDLLRREADIAVRMTEPKQDVLIARRVADVLIGLHAHKDYLARHGTPKKPGDLVQLAKRDSSLVRVLPRQLELKLETWIAMHEDLRGSARCKVTFDALVKALA